MDILLAFVAGNTALKLLTHAASGRLTSSTTLDLSSEFLETFLGKLAAAQADVSAQLSRIEAAVDHLVTAPSQTALSVGSRHFKDAGSLHGARRREALERARSEYYTAAASARNAMKFNPEMGIVAGDAELLIAATLLCLNEPQKAMQALDAVEIAYYRGADSIARRFDGSHQSSVGILISLLSRFNRYRSAIKPAFAPTSACSILIPATNNYAEPHFESPPRLARRVDHLDLAWSPHPPTSTIAMGGYELRIVRATQSPSLPLHPTVHLGITTLPRSSATGDLYAGYSPSSMFSIQPPEPGGHEASIPVTAELSRALRPLRSLRSASGALETLRERSYVIVSNRNLSTAPTLRKVFRWNKPTVAYLRLRADNKSGGLARIR